MYYAAQRWQRHELRRPLSDEPGLPLRCLVGATLQAKPRGGALCLRPIFGSALVWTGIVIVLSGMLFILQSFGIVGPESSYMVENLDWFGYGALTVLVGSVTAIVGRTLQQ